MQSAKSSRLIGYLNFGHGLDHFVMLIFPAAVLALSAEWNRPFGELLPYSTAGFVAFGLFSMPFGWIGKRVTGHRLITLFFLGVGLGCVFAGLSQTPLQLGVALTLIGVFAAIYHPIGNSMLSAIDPARVGQIMGWNGLFGNLGVASAALVTGLLTDLISWRAAFLVPGITAIVIGIAFWMLVPDPGPLRSPPKTADTRIPARAEMTRVFIVLAVGTVIGGFIFSATTLIMPKLFEERLSALTTSVTGIGLFVFVTYMLAALAQLVIGSRADRMPISRLLVPLAMLQVPLMVLIGLVSGVTTLLLALPMMFLVFGLIPINEVMVARYTAPEYRTRIYSIRYTLTFAAVAAAVPTVAAFHSAYGGFSELFFLLAALAVPLALASTLLLFNDQPVRTATGPASA
jgi:MFS family permease